MLKHTILRTIASSLLIASTLLSAACGNDPIKKTSADTKAVMTISNGKLKSDASFSEYRYFWLNNKRDLYGADAEPTAEQLEKLALNTKNNIFDRHALYVFAEAHGVTVTSEDKKTADAYVDAYREECGDDDAYRTALLDQYMTDTLFRELTTDTTIAYALLDTLSQNGTLDVSDAAYDKAAAGDEMICLKEIYIYYPDKSLRDWALERGEEVLNRLKAGEEFEELMNEYSSYDPKQLPPEHGYYTMKYDALDEIWNVASTLKEGQYSELVESDFGVHIILRAKKDKDYMATKRDELYEIFRQSRFYEKFYEFCDTLTIEFTDYGSKLTEKDFE